MLSKNKIKFINSLSLKKNRIKHGQFIAEGTKIVQDLMESNFIIDEIYYTSEIEQISFDNIKWNHFMVDLHELKKISQLKTPQGILAVVRIPLLQLNIKNLANSLTILLDDIQDPGNLGTIIRIANWFNIKTIVCSENSVDVYNPKVIQASMGSLSGVEVHYADLDKIIEEAKKLNIPVYGTFLDGENIYSSNLPDNGMIVFGNESKGISENLKPKISFKIHIPSFNADTTKTNSLNIAIATALVCSEFRRNSFKI